MSRVLRSVRKRKKGCTLGAVDVIDREGYAELEVDATVELIRSLVPLGLLHIEEVLDEEVTALAGERYARKAPSVGGRRHGSNPALLHERPSAGGAVWPALLVSAGATLQGCSRRFIPRIRRSTALRIGRPTTRPSFAAAM